MIKTDLFLKFADEAEAKEILVQNDVVLVDGKIPDTAVIAGYQSAIDVLFGTGIIHKPDPSGATITADGTEYPVMVAVPGYHVNIRIMGECNPEAFQPFMLDPEPTTPKCVFA